MKRVFVVLLMSLLLLAVGGIVVANAQDDTPTPTPVST